jgi:hypothetical protein
VGVPIQLEASFSGTGNWLSSSAQCLGGVRRCSTSLGPLLGSVVAYGFGWCSVSGWGQEFGVAVFCDADLPSGGAVWAEES